MESGLRLEPIVRPPARIRVGPSAPERVLALLRLLEEFLLAPPIIEAGVENRVPVQLTGLSLDAIAESEIAEPDGMVDGGDAPVEPVLAHQPVVLVEDAAEIGALLQLPGGVLDPEHGGAEDILVAEAVAPPATPWRAVMVWSSLRRNASVSRSTSAGVTRLAEPWIRNRSDALGAMPTLNAAAFTLSRSELRSPLA